MRLFACRGRSASLIQNHSEVEVTPATIMPFGSNTALSHL